MCVLRPVGTRGGVEWMRGPCACPRWGEMIQRVSMKPWRNRHARGQAQGPHPSPHPPLVPTERRGRKRSDGYDYPIQLAIFIRTEADIPNHSPIRLSKFIRRTIYWRTADVSANGPSMRSPGRYIGDVHEVLIRAALRFAEAPTIWPILVVKLHHRRVPSFSVTA